VKIWNADTGAEILTLKGYSRFVNSLAFSPDGKRLATLCRDQSLKVFDADSGDLVFTVKTFVAPGGCVAFSPDGKRLACSNNYTIVAESQAQGTREVKVLDAQTGVELMTLKGHSSLRINSVVFSPDGKRIISGTGMGPPAMGEIKVWDAQTGQELLTLEGHSELTHDVAISPDGRHLAARGFDGTLKIFDATPLPEKP
jgi:WD40 repeat protein